MEKVIEVVGAVIENDNQEILCALRSAEMNLAGYWEFPGGKMQEGESLTDALIREIREELDCEITAHERITTTEHRNELRTIRLHTYRAKIVSGMPTAIEHAELRWLPRSRIASLNWAPADLPTVEILRKR